MTAGDRSEALIAARKRRMAEWFEGRRWRVCTELSYEHADVVVDQGEFWVQGGKVFKTPFGNKGTHGYIMQEVTLDTGEDRWTFPADVLDGPPEPVRAPFGWVTLRHAEDMFPGSIVEVPPRPYGHRGGVAAALDKKRNGEL